MTQMEQREAWTRARDASRFVISTLGQPLQSESSEGSSHPPSSVYSSWRPPPPPVMSYATGKLYGHYTLKCHCIRLTCINLLFQQDPTSLWDLHRTCRWDSHRIWEPGHHTLPIPNSWDSSPMEILPSPWRIYVEATSLMISISLGHHSWEGPRYSHRRTCLHRPPWLAHVLSAPQVS